MQGYDIISSVLINTTLQIINTPFYYITNDENQNNMNNMNNMNKDLSNINKKYDYASTSYYETIVKDYNIYYNDYNDYRDYRNEENENFQIVMSDPLIYKL